MNRLVALALTLLIASMLVIPPVYAVESSYAVDKISYYGYLIDRNSGQPVDSAISISLRIYDAENGGTPIWEETHSSVNVEEGYFDVSLGSVNPLAGIDFNRDLWLGVEVNADGEMTPRHELPNLQSLLSGDPENGNNGKGAKAEQIDYGQFGHAVIEITIDYSDIRSGNDEFPPRESDEDPANISTNQLKLPQLNTTSYESDGTGLQSIPVEDERVFDIGEFKVYSNSPRAPGM